MVSLFSQRGKKGRIWLLPVASLDPGHTLAVAQQFNPEPLTLWAGWYSEAVDVPILYTLFLTSIAFYERRGNWFNATETLALKIRAATNVGAACAVIQEHAA